MQDITSHLYKIERVITNIADKYEHELYCILGFFLVVFLIKMVLIFSRRYKYIKKYNKNGDLSKFTWQEFEYFVSEYFSRQGFKVEQQGGSRADGGIDAVIKKGRVKKIVQVKRYKNKVSVSVVREMLGVYRSEKDKLSLTGVVIVTSSSFSRPAVEFANKNNVELIDAYKIRSSMRAH